MGRSLDYVISTNFTNEFIFLEFKNRGTEKEVFGYVVGRSSVISLFDVPSATRDAKTADVEDDSQFQEAAQVSPIEI
jgi:hypothetical protein